MAVGVIGATIGTFFLYFFGVSFWETKNKGLSLILGVVAEIIGVNDVLFLGLIESIVQSENLSAYNLIISIDDERHLVVIAVLMNGIVNIFQGCFMFKVPDQNDSIF